MSVSAIPPIPTSSSAVQLDDRGKPLAGYPLGQDYYLWLFALANLVQSSGQRVGNAVSRTSQTAAIISTPMPLPAVNVGLYVLTVYANVDTPAGATSQLGDFTATWTQNGVVKNATIANSTANLNTTAIFGQIPIRIDANSPVNYAMGYASNPANAMTYSLFVALSQVA